MGCPTMHRRQQPEDREHRDLGILHTEFAACLAFLDDVPDPGLELALAGGKALARWGIEFMALAHDDRQEATVLDGVEHLRLDQPAKTSRRTARRMR